MSTSGQGSSNWEAHDYLAPMQQAEEEELDRLQKLTVLEMESELANLTRNGDPVGDGSSATERRHQIERIKDELFVRSGCQSRIE